MLFPTVEYAIFFLIVLTITWMLVEYNNLKKNFLLAVSYLFYGFWDWHYIPLLFIISLVSGLIAQQIQTAALPKPRKRWLVIGIIFCLGTLIYYKYVGFFIISLLNICRLFDIQPQWHITNPMLPLGVSFFVFHAISLMSDAYRNKLNDKVNLRDALLYIAFFPQLIAGPILRASAFLPQLTAKGNPQSIRVNLALMLICSGLFKKIVISNTLATQLVDPVFASPALYGMGDTLLAIYGYAAQIYCDFSGYTNIAAGCAILLGYSFPRNFNAPYYATDPQDFWRRWHISLSTWLRDYLYIPLGGSHGGVTRTYINLFITMVLGGLWHGANWTFVIWGALHGSYLVIHRYWSGLNIPLLVRLRQAPSWCWISRFLLFHAVCLAWVFFRAPSFEIAFSMFNSLSIPIQLTLATWPISIMLALGLFMQYRPKRWDVGLEQELARWPLLIRGACLAVVIFAIEVLGPSGVAPFIYFQF